MQCRTSKVAQTFSYGVSARVSHPWPVGRGRALGTAHGAPPSSRTLLEAEPLRVHSAGLHGAFSLEFETRAEQWTAWPWTAKVERLSFAGPVQQDLGPLGPL